MDCWWSRTAVRKQEANCHHNCKELSTAYFKQHSISTPHLEPVQTLNEHVSLQYYPHWCAPNPRWNSKSNLTLGNIFSSWISFQKKKDYGYFLKAWRDATRLTHTAYALCQFLGDQSMGTEACRCVYVRETLFIVVYLLTLWELKTRPAQLATDENTL